MARSWDGSEALRTDVGPSGRFANRPHGLTCGDKAVAAPAPAPLAFEAPAIAIDEVALYEDEEDVQVSPRRLPKNIGGI